MKMYNFIEFIMESKGISDICVGYKDIIWEDINYYISNISNDINLKNFIYNFDNERFLINNLVIEISLKKYKENVCNAKFIGDRDHIKNNIFYSPKIELDIYYKNFNDNFLIYIESVLLHELLHCYQMYKMRLKKMPSYWSYGSDISKLRGNDFMMENDEIKDIINLLYFSLEHEMNAQLHQYYDYLLKMESYERIFSIENSLRNFQLPTNIDFEFIFLMKTIIKQFKNSLDANSPNNNYKKKIDNSLWSYDLTEKNIKTFLENLKNYFTNCADYLSRKIRQINRKIENFEHIDYTMKLSETDIFFKLIND